MAILDSIRDPAQLRGLDYDALEALAAELREKMIRTVRHTGGHLASSLGAVEIAIALHRVMDSPRDRIVWDTGHQAYAHKLLTGRSDRFDTLRQVDGISGFPRRSESEHDVFDGGHAGTGVSIGIGLAAARDLLPADDPGRAQRGGGLRGGRRHAERPDTRGPQPPGPDAPATADRAQRQRDEHQPLGGRPLHPPEQAAPDPRLPGDEDRHPADPAAGTPARQAGVRASLLGEGGVQADLGQGRLFRGHGDHLHRGPRRPRPARAGARIRAGIPPARPGPRPRQDGEGPGVCAGRAGQRQLPRRQPAAHRPDRD